MPRSDTKSKVKRNSQDNKKADAANAAVKLPALQNDTNNNKNPKHVPNAFTISVEDKGIALCEGKKKSPLKPLLEPIKSPPKPIVEEAQPNLPLPTKHVLEPVTVAVDDNSKEEATVVVQCEDNASQPQAPSQEGLVTIAYEMYNEEFTIANGTITSASIDELYCLSDIMPNCHIRMSKHSPCDIRELKSSETKTQENLYLLENPQGLFNGLVAGNKYYCYVEQDLTQLEREKCLQRAAAGGRVDLEEPTRNEVERDDGRGFDTCSCIYGTPCVDEYGCRNWKDRFDISHTNGWEGVIQE